MPTLATFRAKRLDLGGFINSKIIRDHTKRKVFEKFEPQRYERQYSTGSSRTTCRPLLLTDNQTSTAVPRPEHLPASTNTRTSTITTLSDALLHPADPDTESMCYGRCSKRCLSGVQDGKGESSSERGSEETVDLVQYQFRMNALAGNLPGVKKASW